MYDPITESEVYSQSLQLDPLKLIEPKNLPIKFFKILASIIRTYLMNAFHKCYETGIFPKLLKNAKIAPIYKAKQRDIASCSRSILLSSPISKI